MSVTLGQVVVSKAGRDTGRKFIVVNIIDENFVEVSDGSLRKLEKPKKKKLKHLIITDERVDSLFEKLMNNMKITNAEIRRALASLSEHENTV